jgi:L-threonylcarbamoyladenylate synthase
VSTVVPATPENLRRAAELLRAGELVGFPTETVYGVGADAANPEAVRRVFRAKGRPASHPLIVHLPAADSLAEWAVEIPDEALALADRFWPGPLTLVLRRSARVPDEVTGGQDTVALRVPAHELAVGLLREFGAPLAAPSANRFGRISPTRAEHVAMELGDDVSLILDGGPSNVGVESTILDLSGPKPRVLRPGGVYREQLEEALGVGLEGAKGGAGPRAPGRLASHYAPVNEVELVGPGQLDQRRGEAVSVLSLRPPPAGFDGRWLRLPAEPRGYARELYAALRELDATGRPILIEAPPEDPEWEVVNDRLARAAGVGRE